MKTNDPHIITAASIDEAWSKAFLRVLDGGDRSPLVVSIRNFEGEIPSQDKTLVDALNQQLRAHDVPTIGQTALTIVPYERWLRMGKIGISELAQWYLVEYLPRLKARCSKNRGGTYFERLVASTGVKLIDGQLQIRTVNQLEFVISIWLKRAEKGGRPRQSALQLSCFDPAKDHTGSALSGFPCLQQVSLTYKEAGTLELNAYYPTQYVLDRAYGNYLGLCQLGHLIAHSLGVRLTAFTCFTGCPEIGPETKTSVRPLAALVRKHLAETYGTLPTTVQNVHLTDADAGDKQ